MYLKNYIPLGSVSPNFLKNRGFISKPVISRHNLAICTFPVNLRAYSKI